MHTKFDIYIFITSSIKFLLIRVTNFPAKKAVIKLFYWLIVLDYHYEAKCYSALAVLEVFFTKS